MYKPFKRLDWMPGALGASLLACLLWGYLLNSGDINSVWTLFGVSNQLMASIGLMVGATIILRLAQKRIYMLTCLVPLAYLYVTVNYAGYWMISNVYLNPAAKGYNLFNAGISIIMLTLGVVIMVASLWRWKKLLRRAPSNTDAGSLLATATAS